MRIDLWKCSIWIQEKMDLAMLPKHGRLDKTAIRSTGNLREGNMTQLLVFLESGGLAWFLALPVLVLVVVVIVGIIKANEEKRDKELEAKKQRVLNEAKVKYYSSLEKVKNKPTSPDLRQETLELGRAYARLTREQKQETIFDEVVLLNDINAACAAAGVQKVAAAKMEDVRQERECPFCAEKILVKAKICKHCGKEFG